MASNYRNSPNTVCRNISMPVDDYDLFSRLYPHMFTKFVQRCVKLALKDRHFLNLVCSISSYSVISDYDFKE